MSKTKASIQTITEVYLQFWDVWIHVQEALVIFVGLKEGDEKRDVTIDSEIVRAKAFVYAWWIGGQSIEWLIDRMGEYSFTIFVSIIHCDQ